MDTIVILKKIYAKTAHGNIIKAAVLKDIYIMVFKSYGSKR